MSERKLSRMTYLGGHSGRKGLLGVLAFPEDFPSETEFTLFYTTIDNKWWQLQFDFDIASVTYLNLPGKRYRGWWLVGKRGEVVEFTGEQPRIDRIETAGTGPQHKYGYLHQIRAIDDELFICGYRRQVYHRKGSRWELISADILDSRVKGPWNGFESIDGFSKDDLYAVGDEGEIWHFNGKTWTQCDSPTNQHLADVRCLGDKVWICGDGGIIFSGDKDRWEMVWDNEEPSESWWSLERFQDRIYIAGHNFLGTLEDGDLVQIDVGIKDDITTQTLHHKEGILWSIGAEDILAYDGNQWKELVCPENR
jgi:hypothetical protein